jgi:predicted CXXCH cytochrome family protein
MKKLTLLLTVAMALAGSAFAFHNRGVASCGGCHTMHNSQDGASIDLDHPSGNPWLLIAGSPSDVCLSCHANSFGSVLGNNPLAPPPERGAGNFVFLLENNINDGTNGATNPIPGAAAGHNINAPAHSLASDGTSPVSPGGTFPSNRMECTSCHDPHGNQNFRLLYGPGPIMGGLYSFTGGPLLADGIDLAAGAEANSNHTAYKSKVTDWCANCHGNFHENSNNTQFDHPAGKELGSGVVQQYDRYNGTSNPTGGTHATAYLAALPFEDASVTTTSTAGPSVLSKVMCLTCHRAHATSAPHAGRWDFNVSLLGNDGVISGSYPIPNPYNDPAQKNLCYKCHVKGTD